MKRFFLVVLFSVLLNAQDLPSDIVDTKVKEDIKVKEDTKTEESKEKIKKLSDKQKLTVRNAQVLLYDIKEQKLAIQNAEAQAGQNLQQAINQLFKELDCNTCRLQQNEKGELEVIVLLKPKINVITK